MRELCITSFHPDHSSTTSVGTFPLRDVAPNFSGE
jgi:hypothetical protein